MTKYNQGGLPLSLWDSNKAIHNDSITVVDNHNITDGKNTGIITII